MPGFKKFALTQASKRLLPLLGKASDENFEKFLILAEKLAPGDYPKFVAGYLLKAWRKRHPQMILLRNVLRDINSNCRDTLLTNFLLRCHWQGHELREKARAQGLPAPFTILISPTMRCNLRCEGCYAAYYSPKDDLELDLIDRVLGEAKELGTYIAVILGGEPFIRQDMWEIYQRHHDMIFHIFTNGTLITREVAQRLADLGNIVPAISIEGFEEDTDARRGKGTFRKIMQAMDNLREAGVPFGFSSMVTRRNVETLVSDEFYDMLIEKGCYLGWHFLYMPVGRDPDTSLMPTPEQRRLLRERGAARLRSEKPIWVMDFWNDAPYVTGCIAGGRHFFHINSRGDVEPCIFQHFAVDNIKQKTLKEVLMSPLFREIRSRQPFHENLLRPCMIIDHPQILREMVAKYGARPTEPGAETIVTRLADELDRYAAGVAREMDPVWEKEFVSRGFSSGIK